MKDEDLIIELKLTVKEWAFFSLILHHAVDFYKWAMKRPGNKKGVFLRLKDIASTLEHSFESIAQEEPDC